MKAGQHYQTASIAYGIQSDEGAEGGLDVGQFLGTLRRKALLIAGVTVALAVAAAAKALTETPVYIDRIEILVQPTTAETTVISSVPETLTGREAQPEGTTVTNDLVKILQSQKVLLPIVETAKTQYPSVCYPIGATDITVDLSSERATQFCYKNLRSKLNVGAAEKESNIMQVVYQSTDPREVRFVLENVSQAYLDYSLQSRQADIQRGLDFVRDKIPGLEEQVQALQEQLQQLRLSNDLIDPSLRGNQLSDQLNTFTQEQLSTQIELEQTRALYADLQQQLAQRSQETAASSALGQNPRYQTLLNQLLELDSEIAAASTLFYDDTDEIQLLREQRQNLLVLLEQEGAQAERSVVGQIQELEAREQALRETISSLNGGVDELSGLSRSYTDIQRELDIATENLNQFLTKREALQIDVAQREVPWELLTPPSEAEAIAASLARNLVLGTVLGLLLGTGLAIVSDKFTDIVYTPEELKRLTGLPLLGIIPPNQDLTELVPETEAVALLQPSGGFTPFSGAEQNGSTRPYKVVHFLEAFRSLYANLRLLNLDTRVQSVVISSSVPAEGKSTIAACLAQAAAAMGQRVLLVDADLRRPRVHEYLGLPNDRGITDMIVEGLNFSEVVQRSTLEPNLFVLTAGQTPPDPTRLLSSQKMQTFMEQVQNRFDFIIYDTPPMVGFADPYLLASHTSGIILVTELGRLKRSSLEQALEQSRVSSTPILGVVARSKKPLNF